LAFSFYTNLIKLFKTQPNGGKRTDMIGCLNGIRVLSILWIMFGHRMTTMYAASPKINFVFFLDWVKQYPSMIVYAGTVAVDTFFLLSGLLVTKGMLRELDKNRSLNIVQLYVHRYLRLTPSIAMVIFVNMSLAKYLGSGPFWKASYMTARESCDKSWWVTLLYFQNYFRKEEMVRRLENVVQIRPMIVLVSHSQLVFGRRYAALYFGAAFCVATVEVWP
jgi:peptidoglycan/LPS O-acetylase OafA/YrhL